MNDRDIYETFSMPAQGASWLATSQGFGVELSFLLILGTKSFLCDGHDLMHLSGKRSFSVRVFSFGSPFLYAWRQGNLVE
jgi:hypothetical protein